MNVWKNACNEESCYFLQEWESKDATTKGYCTILYETDHYLTGGTRGCSFKKTVEEFERTEAASARRKCRMRREGLLCAEFKIAN